MTILDRLEQWQKQGAISPEQNVRLTSLVREEPFSLFMEINILLYAGVLAFVAGLGWTVTTWSQQLGTVVIVVVLSVLLAGCLWYCFSRAAPWSPEHTPASSPIFDYVLYLGSLAWCVELAYLEKRFNLLSEQWDLYLLATACFFFFLAYRFDNRLVLSLALSSLAGWLGVTISHTSLNQDSTYRLYAVLYCLIVAIGGALLHRAKVKPHFFDTYLNLVANVLFWTVLSGVFEQQGSGLWIVALLLACGASVAWGLKRKQFAFVAYAAVYGYVGVSWLLIRGVQDVGAVLAYFVITAVAMLVTLVLIARRFGRSA